MGAWVSTQRRHFKMKEAGESTPLSQLRMDKLEAIGFKWSAKNPRHLQWESRFQALISFKEKYGHTQVPINWDEDVQLANWVSTQRQEYQNLLKGRTTRLDERRMRMLNGIGFAWQLQRGGRKRHLQPKDGASGAEDEDTESEASHANAYSSWAGMRNKDIEFGGIKCGNAPFRITIGHPICPDWITRNSSPLCGWFFISSGAPLPGPFLSTIKAKGR